MSDSRMFLRLLSWLTRDPSEERRPKHPRPAVVPRPQVPRPIDVGKPPRDGSGVLPAPSPDCPHCEVGKVEELDNSIGRAFTKERFRCCACKRHFTREDAVAFAKAKARDVDELHSTGPEGNKTFVPRPPKVPTLEDRVLPRMEGDVGEMARSYRDERHQQGGVPMNQGGEPIETDLRGGLRPNDKGAPTELSWTNHETKRETSAIWSAMKWIIGIGASIGIGWLIEWAFF